MSPTLLALIFALLVSGMSCVEACGLNWWLSRSGPYENTDNFGHAELRERIGEVRLSNGDRLPVLLLFQSHSDHASPWAGHGWSIPLLDARMVQEDADRFRFWMPDGLERVFHRDAKQRDMLHGDGGWRAQIKGNLIEVASNCGDSILLSAGRPIRMTLGDTRIDYSTGDGGNSIELREAGRLLIKARPDPLAEDEIIIESADGRLAGLKLGERPLVQEISGRRVVSAMAPALASVSRPGGAVTAFGYDLDDSLTPALRQTRDGRKRAGITWHPTSRHILSDGSYDYRVSPRDNPDYFAIIERGRGGTFTEKWDFDIAKGTKTVVDDQGVTRIERWFASGALATRLREVAEVRDGKRSILEKYSYDEKGRVVRETRNGRTTRFLRDDEKLTCTAVDEATKATLWTKFLDAEGRTIMVAYPDGSTLEFDYRNPTVVMATLTRDGVQATARWNKDTFGGDAQFSVSRARQQGNTNP